MAKGSVRVLPSCSSTNVRVGLHPGWSVARRPETVDDSAKKDKQQAGVDDIYRQLGDAVPFRKNSEVVFAHDPLRLESNSCSARSAATQARFFVRNGHQFLRMLSAAKAFVGIFVGTARSSAMSWGSDRSKPPRC